MDELRILAPVFFAIIAAFHYLRGYVRGYMTRFEHRFEQAERSFAEAQHARLRESCCELSAEKREAESEEMRTWLANVAPLLGYTPDVRYKLTERILADGSGYLVNGRVYPIHPTPPGADYYRGDQGLRLATQEEIAAMRAEESTST